MHTSQTLHILHTLCTYITNEIYVAYITNNKTYTRYIQYIIKRTMHTYIHTYIHTCLHAYIHTYTQGLLTYMHTCIHAYRHTYVHTYMHVYTQALLTYMHNHAYIHMCIHAGRQAGRQICTYQVYVYIHRCAFTDV